MTENHAAVTQDVFLRLLEKGYLVKGTTTQYYDPEAAYHPGGEPADSDLPVTR